VGINIIINNSNYSKINLYSNSSSHLTSLVSKKVRGEYITQEYNNPNGIGIVSYEKSI